MKKRIYEYDVIRTVATLSVIFVHISAMAIMGYEAYSPHSMMTIWLNRLLKFTTPVFIYLAGALIYESYQNKPFKYFDFLRKRTKRIIFPYVLVSIMYYGLLTYMSRGVLSLSVFAEQLLTGSVQYHLYFIPIIIQMYLLTPIFLWLKKHIPIKIILPVVIVISYVSTLKMKFQYSDRIFIKFVVPYLIGLYFGGTLITWLKSLKKKSYILLLATLTAGGFYAYMWMMLFYGKPSPEMLRDSGWFVYCILSCLTLTWLSTFVSGHNLTQKITGHFSKISYYIYLLHPLFLAVAVKFLNKYGVLSTTVRFGFNLVFVVIVSIVAADLIYRFNQLRFFEKFLKLKKKIKIPAVVIVLIFGGMSSVYAYDFLVERGYIISFEAQKEAKRVEDMIEAYQNSETWYENSNYGFKFNYENFDVKQDNEVVKTTFENEQMSIDIFYENLNGTVHTSDTFTFYGNRSIVDGPYVTVLDDQFMTVNNQNVHVLKWERQALKHVKNDFTHYLSVDFIKNTHEVYNITVRSKNDVDAAEIMARFKISEMTFDESLSQKQYVQQENNSWNAETKDFYENFSQQDLKWGFFEPTTVKEQNSETLFAIEESVDYQFNYVLQYYNIDSYVNVDQINQLYKDGRILEFTLQTSEYYNPSSDATFKLLDGYYDEQLEGFANSMSKIDGPVLFRLNNEMTGDWVFYNAFFYQKDASLYIKMWQYIYNKFEEAGAENVVWIFNPNESSFPGFKWNHYSNYFPGEEYVDIIGVTGYNTGDYHPGETWREFEDIYDEFMPEYIEVFKDYPMMITEFGSSTFGGDKVKWMEDMFESIGKYPFNAAIYWNSVDKDPADNETPARIYKFDDDPSIVEVFRNYLNPESF